MLEDISSSLSTADRVRVIAWGEINKEIWLSFSLMNSLTDKADWKNNSSIASFHGRNTYDDKIIKRPVIIERPKQIGGRYKKAIERVANGLNWPQHNLILFSSGRPLINTSLINCWRTINWLVHKHNWNLQLHSFPLVMFCKKNFMCNKDVKQVVIFLFTTNFDEIVPLVNCFLMKYWLKIIHWFES